MLTKTYVAREWLTLFPQSTDADMSINARNERLFKLYNLIISISSHKRKSTPQVHNMITMACFKTCF